MNDINAYIERFKEAKIFKVNRYYRLNIIETDKKFWHYFINV